MKIIRRLEILRRTEHSSTVGIVKALVICEREQAYLELGYSSLWVYLVEGLRYSQAAASRRYRAAKCAAKYPQVIGMLRDHRVSLSSLSKVEALLGKVENPVELLERICGKSQVQVERLIAGEFPRDRRPREVVKREFVKVAVAKGVAKSELPTPTSTPTPVPTGPARPAICAADVEVPRVEERVSLRTSLTADRFEALERARAIYSRKRPGATVEDLLNELVDHYLAAKAPKVREEKKGAVPSEKSSNPDAPQSVSPKRTPPDPSPRTRHIPVAVRDAVMLRDGERCTFRGKSGHRCSATHNLQIDHIRPFALGGGHRPDNLRVLCAAHNRHEADKVFGKWTPGRVEPEAVGV